MNKPKQETVIVRKCEFKRLVDRDFFLNCLEAAGVDNWEGYSCALEEYNAGEGKEHE